MGRWTGRHGKQDGRMQRDKTESWWGDGQGDMEKEDNRPYRQPSKTGRQMTKRQTKNYYGVLTSIKGALQS